MFETASSDLTCSGPTVFDAYGGKILMNNLDER